MGWGRFPLLRLDENRVGRTGAEKAPVRRSGYQEMTVEKVFRAGFPIS